MAQSPPYCQLLVIVQVLFCLFSEISYENRSRLACLQSQNEGAQFFWLKVTNSLRNRWVEDIVIAVVDDLHRPIQPLLPVRFAAGKSARLWLGNVKPTAETTAPASKYRPAFPP
jgi:hypothetical protein